MLYTPERVNRYVDYTGFPSLAALKSYPPPIQTEIRKIALQYLDESTERLSNESDIAYLRFSQKGH
jgi:hypothetical protein